MKFSQLEIRNFRAIQFWSIRDLTDFVVIAGANGSGKSSVFDAIRLLKSLYGGYEDNEQQHWFGEFSIDPTRPNAVTRLFRDQSQSILIEASLYLSSDELNYLRNNLRDLCAPIVWQELTGRRPYTQNYLSISLEPQYQSYRDEYLRSLDRMQFDLQKDLNQQYQQIRLEILPDGTTEIAQNRLMSVIFQTFQPQHLGIIEYHSASRSYGREQVGGINLDSRQFTEQQRSYSLYNWQAKYQNIKTALATAYIHSLISQQAQPDIVPLSLDSTLSELFQTFFPDKEYQGVLPMPDGTLGYPVKTKSGHTHDIDDLSSGEKEILYGYLRIYNSQFRNSVILLDEPELHLNPSLLNGFPDFYHRHLGSVLGNQIWMVTHSDALLRQTIGNSEYSVFHMLSAASETNDSNQAISILVDSELDRAVLDLIGDMATYRPHAKVLILEGDAPSDFDASFVQRLFPAESSQLNIVSGGHKSRVQSLYNILDRFTSDSNIQNRFYAVVDQDFDNPGPVTGIRTVFSWGVYHIENFLLHPESISNVVLRLHPNRNMSPIEVQSSLKASAERIIERQVGRLLSSQVNQILVGSIDTRISPNSDRPVHDLIPRILTSSNEFLSSVDSLTKAELESRADKIRERFTSSILDGSWDTVLPGREILKDYLHQMNIGTTYEAFVNLVLDYMSSNEIKPDKMRKVLRQIIDDPGDHAATPRG